MAKVETETGRKPRRRSSRHRLQEARPKASADSPAAAKPSSRARGESKTSHLSFRAPTALVEAAKRETGITSPTALAIAGLAMLAQPDPVVAFMKRNRGRLGENAELDY